MEANTPEPKKSDEINVGEFFSMVGRGLRSVGHQILLGVAAIRNTFVQYIIFFVVLVIIGIAAGAFYFAAIKKDYYRSTMVLNCNYLNTQVLSNIVDKLNLLSNSKNSDILIEELQIDTFTAQNILKFEFRPFVSEDDILELELLRSQLTNLAADKKNLVNDVVEKLKIEGSDAYEITVLVLDPAAVKPLERGIINYLLNNPYIKRRIEINTVNMKERRRKLVADSRRLDSLKTVLLTNYQSFGKTSRGSNNVILADEALADPINVFKESLLINDEILEIDRRLYLGSDFEIVDPFTTFRHTESVGLITTIVFSLGGSLILGFLIIAAVKLDQLLANYGKAGAETRT